MSHGQAGYSVNTYVHVHLFVMGECTFICHDRKYRWVGGGRWETVVTVCSFLLVHVLGIIKKMLWNHCKNNNIMKIGDLVIHGIELLLADEDRLEIGHCTCII